MDVLNEFVPGYLETQRRNGEILPKVQDAIESLLERGETQSLKEITPLFKILVDENKRVLDRHLGSSVQRQQIESTTTVRHVSLRELMDERDAEANAHQIIDVEVEDDV